MVAMGFFSIGGGGGPLRVLPKLATIFFHHAGGFFCTHVVQWVATFDRVVFSHMWFFFICGPISSNTIAFPTKWPHSWYEKKTRRENHANIMAMKSMKIMKSRPTKNKKHGFFWASWPQLRKPTGIGAVVALEITLWRFVRTCEFSQLCSFCDNIYSR